MLKLIFFVFSLVGFEGNLSLLDVFPGVLSKWKGIKGGPFQVLFYAVMEMARFAITRVHFPQP